MTASLRYEDGKTLKGIGTRASKSRLPGVAAFSLALSNRYENNSKGRQERTSWLLLKGLRGGRSHEEMVMKMWKKVDEARLGLLDMRKLRNVSRCNWIQKWGGEGKR